MTETTQPLQLAPGEVLFSIGESGDTVYVVIEGELEVIAPTSSGEMTVGRLGTDDLVGEITAVIGGTRTASVRAAVETTVQPLDEDQFERWLRAHPDKAERLASEARDRIDRTRVARVVAELVGDHDAPVVQEMTNAVEWLSIEAGDTLFDQGDEADAAYILVAGQMRVQATALDGTIVLDTRIGRGELIGEMGVIEQAPRSASARAIRDCTLARIPKAAFEDLTSRHPALMLPLVRRVVERVGRRSHDTPHAGTICIAVTAPDVGDDLCATITAEIERHGPVMRLHPDAVERFMNRRDIANAATGSAAEARLTEFLHEADVAHRWVLLECDGEDSAWSRRVLRSADRVVMVCSAQPSSDEQRRIARNRDIVEATGDYDLWLAQINPAGRSRPVGTAALLDLSGAHRVVQVSDDNGRSIRRLARLVSGNGLGVAFSGGGARSFGQIGAMRALDELGVEVDAMTGTSMGSVIGAFSALIDDVDEAMSLADEKFTGIKLLDYTLPMAAIFEGKLLTEKIDSVFRGIDVLDTRIPFLCLSTNLSKARLHEHRRGDLAFALRASVSLPGVFPPVPFGDDLLVDGGVLENLPAGPLRRDPGVSTVLAIDVAPPEGPRARRDFGGSLSGFAAVKRRITKGRFDHPPLAHTVISSMLVGSSQARKQALENEDIDHYLSLNLSGVKLLDFEQLKPAIERGYEGAKPDLERWFAKP